MLNREFQVRAKELRYVAHMLRKNPMAIVGIVIIVGFVVIIALAPWIAPYGPYDQDLANRLKPPTPGHRFGTDSVGRDVYSRVIHGAKYSIAIGLTVILSASIIGTLFGTVSGYFGGKLDEAMMRLTDMFLSFPYLILAVVIAAALGPSLDHAMIAIAAVWWPEYARLARGSVLAEKEKEYVEAARAIGEGNFSIILRYITPNILTPIMVKAMMDIGIAIMVGSGLSFIGVGAQPPSPEWGAIIITGRDFIMKEWWIATFPGIALLFAVMGFNLFGDGLRDALDPRLRR